MAYDVHPPSVLWTTTKSMANRPRTPSRASRSPIVRASTLIALA